MADAKTGPRTAKQAAFIREYLIDMTAAAAARRAGYSQRTADKIGPELLRKPHIRAAVDAALAERAERAELTAVDVLKGLHKEATNESEGSSHSARVAAWAHIGKHLGMFTEKVELSGEVKRAEPDATPERAIDAAATALRRRGLVN